MQALSSARLVGSYLSLPNPPLLVLVTVIKKVVFLQIYSRECARRLAGAYLSLPNPPLLRLMRPGDSDLACIDLATQLPPEVCA